MATLSVADRTRVWRGLMRRWSDTRTSCGATKYNLYNPSLDTGAIADIDDWVENHQGTTSADTIGMNGALSAPMRTILIAEQKTDILIGVVSMRRGIEYLKSIFGEVD